MERKILILMFAVGGMTADVRLGNGCLVLVAFPLVYLADVAHSIMGQ